MRCSRSRSSQYRPTILVHADLRPVALREGFFFPWCCSLVWLAGAELAGQPILHVTAGALSRLALSYPKMTRIHALREAQLTLYHHPERIPVLVGERGIRFDRVVALPKGTNLDGGKATKSEKAPTKAWASFVLSGVGN